MTTSPTATSTSTTTPHTRTDFSQYTHQQLIAMLYASDPASVRAAAAKWDAVGQFLHAQSGDLDKQLAGFDSKWSGSAAAQYHVMMQDLSGGIRTVATNAWSMRDVALDSADALDTARAQMPQPVAVPNVDPATISMATTPVTVPADASPAQVATVQQQQSQAAAAVRAQQQAQAGADAAHTRAVQVMTTLADHYTVDTDRIPKTPSATGSSSRTGSTRFASAIAMPDVDASGGAVPVLGSDGQPILGADGLPIVSANGALLGADGQPLSAAEIARLGGSILPSCNGVFGGMFAAGLAAASAAALGRFGSVLPKVPAFATGRGANGKKDPDAKDSSTVGGGLPAGGGLGGLGGGVGGVGGLDTGATATDGPTAYHGMGGSSGLSTGLTAAAAAAPLAARAASGMGGFMPAMPMGAGMGAGGDSGGTKRIPPWLVETEDVWGESSQVSPSVIGEDPDAATGWAG